MRRFNQGSVLVTCLLLLLMLNLLTLTALQNSTLEERLSGQVRLHEHAFAAAETALAQAEQDVLHQVNDTILCSQRDELGVWHGSANQLECLKQSVAPCMQGWCGPQAEEVTDGECRVFNPTDAACWVDAPIVISSSDGVEISARTVVKLRECRSDSEREVCLFDIFARAFSVLLQSQFEVIASRHSGQVSVNEDNSGEKQTNGSDPTHNGERECI